MVDDLVIDHWYLYCIESGYPFSDDSIIKLKQAISVVQGILDAYLNDVNVGVSTPRYSYAIIEEGVDFIDVILFFED